MKAYSNDLRERVAAACAEPGATQTAVAARFCVSVSFVEKLRQRQRASGSLAALPHRSGPAPLLDAAGRALVGACLRQQPDATLAELRVWVAALDGPVVSQATMGRAVQALDWRRKKRVSMPPSATPSA
ncbi:MAG: transposase [Hymenobacter sp.]|nr:MAG: transposase [Hymenobacter sp.]